MRWTGFALGFLIAFAAEGSFIPDFKVRPDDYTVLMAADGNNPEGLKPWISDHRKSQVKEWPLGGTATWLIGNTAFAASYDNLRSEFTNLPLSKRLTMPLFWVHGEPKEILLDYVDRIKEGGNGNFVLEPRPHPDWLGPHWWSDFATILDYAQTKGIGCYIYDEGKGWQSFNAGGKVPRAHMFKTLRSTVVDVAGPTLHKGSGYSGANYIKTIAGKFLDNKFVNLARGRVAGASSFSGPGGEADKATDGNMDSRWSTGKGMKTGQWLEVDFGSDVTFNCTLIREPLALDRTTSYNIQYWDGKSWVTCVTGTGIGYERKDKFKDVTASKIRLLINSAWSDPTICEFEVYRGDPTTTGLDASTLTDLTQNIKDGNLSWDVPTGTWRIMNFFYETALRSSLDLASQDAIDWYLDYVIKPHYEHTKPRQILGSFYDEPYFRGTWGKGMENDSPHWKEMMVSQFQRLLGEDHDKATYEYWRTLCERMGRVGYGTYRDYLHAKDGILIGHDNEDRPSCRPLDFGSGALNLMEKQKYQDMPGLDLVSDQMYTRQEKYWIYQLPKLVSSVAISNNLPNHYSLCEIFGAYRQLTWTDRKWLGDWCQVHGVNVMIPHAFNAKGSMKDPDPDCPPFYYYTGDETNWPNYKSWCERQNRLSYMLTGNDANNYSIAPVAMLWPGYSKYVDESWNDLCYPYNFQTALDRVQYDHQLLTYDRFENTAMLNPTTREIELFNSKYKILIMPPVEHIPYATLVKVKQFYDNGGVIMGWQRVPSRSAKFGNSDAEIQKLSASLWDNLMPTTSLTPIKSNANGGKTYFIGAADEETILANLRRILSNASIDSDFKVISGTFDKWTGYNHRKRNGVDVFMVWNGTATEATITARFQAAGGPELWNPTTLAVTPLKATRISLNEVEVELTIPADESCLIVFKPLRD